MRVRKMFAVVMLTTIVVGFSSISTTMQAQGRHDPGKQSETDAQCTLSFPAYLSPGLTAEPQSGTFDSRGETGTINCVGKIYGHTITGPGPFGFTGTLTNSTCFFHNTVGNYFLTVPTDAGPLRIDGGFTTTGVGAYGNVQATSTDFHFVGTYLFLPNKGNCALEPVTEASVSMNGTVRYSPAAPREIKCDLDLGIVSVGCQSRS